MSDYIEVIGLSMIAFGLCILWICCCTSRSYPYICIPCYKHCIEEEIIPISINSPSVTVIEIESATVTPRHSF
jgi:hypothetical protein